MRFLHGRDGVASDRWRLDAPAGAQPRDRGAVGERARPAARTRHPRAGRGALLDVFVRDALGAAAVRPGLEARSVPTRARPLGGKPDLQLEERLCLNVQAVRNCLEYSWARYIYAWASREGGTRGASRCAGAAARSRLEAQARLELLTRVRDVDTRGDRRSRAQETRRIAASLGPAFSLSLAPCRRRSSRERLTTLVGEAGFARVSLSAYG